MFAGPQPPERELKSESEAVPVLVTVEPTEQTPLLSQSKRIGLHFDAAIVIAVGAGFLVLLILLESATGTGAGTGSGGDGLSEQQIAYDEAEHWGSGFGVSDLPAENGYFGAPLKLSWSDGTGSSEFTTNDRVLTIYPSQRSSRGYATNEPDTRYPITVSFAEVIAFGGDYFGPQSYAEMICPTYLVYRGSEKSARGLDQTDNRFKAAFNIMYANPLWYATNGQTVASYSTVISQAREMLELEQKSLRSVASDWLNKPVSQTSANGDPRLSTRGYAQYVNTDFPNEYGWSYTKAFSTWGAANAGRPAASSKFNEFWEMAQNTFWNDDHFSNCGRNTYYSGHEIARKLYADAMSTTDSTARREKLNRAYLMEAFSLHFLSDLFSAGHIRTQRYELRTATDSATYAGSTARCQHDEDNRNCLLVTNRLKQVWWACGDERFYDRLNYVNRQQLYRAVETSLNDLRGTERSPRGNPVMDLIPLTNFNLQFFSNLPKWSARLRQENTCPRFFVDVGNWRYTVRRNTNTKSGVGGQFGSPRTLYAQDKKYPNSKLAALTATKPWEESDLQSVFGDQTISATDKSDACTYWPWVSLRERGAEKYVCAYNYEATKASPNVDPEPKPEIPGTDNAESVTWTLQCSDNGFKPDNSVSSAPKWIHLYPDGTSAD